MEAIEILVSRVCIACDGRGTQDGYRSACETCKGSGRILARVDISELSRLLQAHQLTQVA